MVSLDSKLQQYESRYQKNDYNVDGQASFFIKEGSLPILLSAPHAVKHFRDGKEKDAEHYTGGMAELLGELTNCHVMSATGSSQTDYNYDEADGCLYKQALRQLIKTHGIKVVLDLHGANEKRDFAADLGTIDAEDTSLKECRYIADIIRDCVKQSCSDFMEPTAATKNALFTAGNKNTVTNYISRTTEASCLQVEINWLYRKPDEGRVEAMIRALAASIEAINERLD